MRIEKLIRTFVIIFMFIFVGLFICSCRLGSGTTIKNTKTDAQVLSTAQPQKETLEEKPIEVTTAQLRTDYKENPFAADKKYKDKLLNITGRVLFINKNSEGKPCIDFIADTSIDSILCTFDTSDDPELVNVKPDKIIKLQGRCVGQQDSILPGDKICINNCRLLSVSDNPNPTKKRESLMYQYYNNKQTN